MHGRGCRPAHWPLRPYVGGGSNKVADLMIVSKKQKNPHEAGF